MEQVPPEQPRLPASSHWSKARPDGPSTASSYQTAPLTALQAKAGVRVAMAPVGAAKVATPVGWTATVNGRLGLQGPSPPTRLKACTLTLYEPLGRSRAGA